MAAYLQLYQEIVQQGLLDNLKKDVQARKISSKYDAPLKNRPVYMKGLGSAALMLPRIPETPEAPSESPKHLPEDIVTEPPPPSHEAAGLPTAPPGLPPPPGLTSCHRELEEDHIQKNALNSSSGQTTCSKQMTGTVPGMKLLDQTPDGKTPVQWTVDARKLKSTDKVIVSPSFEIRCGARSSKCKLMIFPDVLDTKRGGSTFRKSKGKAYVEVKCESNPPEHEVEFTMAVTDIINTSRLTPCCGPFHHNFAEANICKIQQVWDLPCDANTSTFQVLLCVHELTTAR